jgi:hypothetical protein
LSAEKPMPLTIRENPEAKPQSMVTVGSRAAGVTLGGGKSGGNGNRLYAD